MDISKYLRMEDTYETWRLIRDEFGDAGLWNYCVKRFKPDKTFAKNLMDYYHGILGIAIDGEILSENEIRYYFKILPANARLFLIGQNNCPEDLIEDGVIDDFTDGLGHSCPNIGASMALFRHEAKVLNIARRNPKLFFTLSPKIRGRIDLALKRRGEAPLFATIK